MVQRMARFKHYDYAQTKMIPLRFTDQIQPGTFEYILSHVIDNEFDLTVFESHYRNDYNGASAYVMVCTLTQDCPKCILNTALHRRCIKHYYEAAEYKGIH